MNERARLSDQALGTLPDDVQRPAYVRADCSVGIVHIGVGHFHRAHQALVIDRLLTQGRASDWAICGVALLPTDEGLARALQQQSGLYTLVEKSIDRRMGFSSHRKYLRGLVWPGRPRCRSRSIERPRNQDRVADHYRRRVQHHPDNGRF